MRAIVLDHPGSFRVAEVPDPKPGPGQIVVKVEACGICGTDLHIMDGEFPPTPYPITPGHEFAGTVVESRAEARMHLPVGTRVAVDPSLYCGYCRRCRSGRDNLCENWAAIGDTVNGAFAEYVAVPAVNAHRLPADLDGQLGAMVEPLACAVHGMRRLGPVFGDTVVLTGAGTMGLLLLQLLLHAGAGPVTVVDRVADRLAVARKLGAAQVAADTSALEGERFEIAVDATGVPAVIDAAAGARGDLAVGADYKVDERLADDGGKGRMCHLIPWPARTRFSASPNISRGSGSLSSGRGSTAGLVCRLR